MQIHVFLRPVSIRHRQEINADKIMQLQLPLHDVPGNGTNRVKQITMRQCNSYASEDHAVATILEQLLSGATSTVFLSNCLQPVKRRLDASN